MNKFLRARRIQTVDEQMSFEELQEIVSVCLDEIMQLKEAHAELRDSRDSYQKETEQQITQLRQKIYVLQCEIAYLKNREKIRGQSSRPKEEQEPPFCGRGVVYSAITGNYDQVKEIPCRNPDLDYILFTDNPRVVSNTWEVRYLENPDELSSVRLARRVKILGHEYLPEYDYSIWVDGKLEIIGDLGEYVERYRDSRPILCFSNFTNDCVYEEEKLCEALRKDDEQIMRQQMECYRREGYPIHNGMIESAVLVRELKNQQVIAVMNTWWQQIVEHSFRDQLSFNYACWKNGFLYDTSNLLVYLNDYVALHPHG